jgi:type II secretion system protein H
MPHRPHDSGFTMIELLVTISLMGIMMAIAVTGWLSWTKASAQSGSANELESTLRQTQQRAVTEARNMCVRFETGQDVYNVYTGECDDGPTVKVAGPFSTDRAEVHFGSPSFTGRHHTGPGVTFYARGSASPGTVQVTRTGESKVYTLRVEGLTGRVSLS